MEETVFIKQSGGGVTFSGGEPMLQHDFLLEALKACKSKGFNTLSILPVILLQRISSQLFLLLIFSCSISNIWMIKNIWNSQEFQTGRFWRITNLLAGSCNAIMIRIPVIPGYNDDPEHLEKLRQLHF